MLKAIQFTNLELIVEKVLQAFRRCSKGYLLYLNASCCGTVRSRSFWMVLERVRVQSWAIGIGTEINGRTARSDRRAGNTKRSNTSCENFHR